MATSMAAAVALNVPTISGTKLYLGRSEFGCQRIRLVHIDADGVERDLYLGHIFCPRLIYRLPSGLE